MTRKNKLYNLNIVLLFCIMQLAGMNVFAQVVVVPQDTVTWPNDSIIEVRDYVSPDVLDSLATNPVFNAVADSILQINNTNMEDLQAVEGMIEDPEATLLSADSLKVIPQRELWIPDSRRATWLAVVFPGGGQIYNRKYWKLPIIYGGFAGCAYALSWNSKTYREYSQAYIDIMDGNPDTRSYEDLFGRNVVPDEGESSYSQRLQRGKDRFRRYRDLSIFAFIGVYLISIIDAYVDAELSNFDIGPDLSIRIEPTIITDKKLFTSAIGVQWSIRF